MIRLLGSREYVKTFSYYEQKVKQANKIWGTIANIFGDQGNLSLKHFREQLLL